MTLKMVAFLEMLGQILTESLAIPRLVNALRFSYL